MMFGPNRDQQKALDWMQRYQAAPGSAGSPPLMSAPNPVAHNPSQIPFADRDFRMLNPDQKAARQGWMADEARRLIEARQATTRLDKPARINQIHDPRQANDVGNGEQAEVRTAAAALTSRLAERDESNRGFW